MYLVPYRYLIVNFMHDCMASTERERERDLARRQLNMYDAF